MAHLSNARTVLLTGATGMIGRPLLIKLLQEGYRVRVLTRDPERARAQLRMPADYVQWDPQQGPPPAEAFAGVGAVVHLAGESVAGSRWTAERKREIRESRALGTRHLVDAIAALSIKPEVLVSASAVGFYGDRGEEELNETAGVGRGFLPEVCADWEAEALRAQSLGVRTVLLRTGIVLHPDGGALAELLPIFRLGLGGPLAGGKHWMSWIHLDDLVDLFLKSLDNSSYRGPVNGTAPHPVRNAEFTRCLAQAVGRPAFFPVPGLAIRAAFGEMSGIVLASQRVPPRAALARGFKFRFETLTAALSDLLRWGEEGIHRLSRVTWVPAERARVFAFFSEPANLEDITPPWLNFRIDQRTTAAVEKGMLIDYSLRLRHIPIRWRTLIEEWSPPNNFVDRQLRGPYRLWVHRHGFEDLQGGTLVSDQVSYKIPFGVLGDLAQQLFVKRDLERIFDHRADVIARRMGSKLATWAFIFFAAVGAVTAARAESPSDPEVVAKVDLARYAGFWFEVAHSPNFFQRKCLRSTAEYAVLDKATLSVHNVCHQEGGKLSDIHGKAVIRNPEVPAKLKVRFNFFARGDYWIVHLADDYQWAVVSGPKKRSIFILARTVPMEPEVLERILSRMDAEGYDVGRLIYDQP